MLRRNYLRQMLLLAVPVAALLSGHQSGLQAQDAKDGIGVWDGAIWRFSLMPAKGNPRPGPLRGRYRVENLELFQAETMEEKEMTKKVGSSHPGPGRKPEFTIVKFEDLRTFSRSQEKVVFKKLEGRVFKGAERGEVEGKLISGDGYHWTFKATRIQE